jgi:hypothetical protein
MSMVTLTQDSIWEVLLYHSVQSFLSVSCLCLKNLKIQIHTTMILLMFCMGVKLRTLTLKVAYWLKVFENKVLRRICLKKRNSNMGGKIT